MSEVICEVMETELENDDGRWVDGVVATCGDCGNTTESFGTSERSVRRCLVMMRDECPEGASNFYVAD
jgi:ribosomal protein S27E